MSRNPEQLSGVPGEYREEDTLDKKLEKDRLCPLCRNLISKCTCKKEVFKDKKERYSGGERCKICKKSILRCHCVGGPLYPQIVFIAYIRKNQCLVYYLYPWAGL